MENIDKKVCSNSCGCNTGCGCGMGMNCGMGRRTHMIIRAILGMILVMMIFSAGFKLGAIVGSVHGMGGYGMKSHMMGGWDKGGMMKDIKAPAATTGTTTQ